MSSAKQVSAGGGAEQGGPPVDLVDAESASGLPEAGSSNPDLILEVAQTLASNPEFGPFLQRGLQSSSPTDSRAGWGATLKQYHLLVRKRTEEGQGPMPFEQATVHMLGSLARGSTVQVAAPAMVKDGLITDVGQVDEVWAILGDSLGTFLSPGFWERPDNRKKVELARLDEAFTTQPPQVIVRAILRLGRAPAEEMEAVCQFFDEENATPPQDTPLSKGLNRFGQMCQRAYHGTPVPEANTRESGFLRQQLISEKGAFEHLSGSRSSGLPRPESYAAFIERTLLPRKEAAQIVRGGLLRVLRFYVYRHDFDVTKLMTAIGLKPLESQPVVEVEPVPLLFTASAQKRALACMAVTAVQAGQPRPSSASESA